MIYPGDTPPWVREVEAAGKVHAALEALAEPEARRRVLIAAAVLLGHDALAAKLLEAIRRRAGLLPGPEGGD